VVERSTADRQVAGSTPAVSSFFRLAMQNSRRPNIRPSPLFHTINDSGAQEMYGALKVEELVPKAKLAKLIQLLAPQERFDLDVLQVLSDIAEDLVLNTMEEACQIASLKENPVLEPRDVLFVLGKQPFVILLMLESMFC
jgi:histone H3/H4